MKRFLAWFNLLGVAALAVLCGVQWNVNRRLNLEGIEQERARLGQVALLVEKEKAIAGYKADLEEFRQRVERGEAAVKEAGDKLEAMTGERDGAAGERDRAKGEVTALQTALEKWTAAVAARDGALKTAQAEIEKVAGERDAAIGKFNDLAGKYNTAGEELKTAAEEVKKLATERNEAVAKFNELAAKYNALVRGNGGAASRP